MSNVFVALPVTAADGIGAWVDTSAMVGLKTLSVDGGDFSGTLYIEGSNDAQASASPVDVSPFIRGQVAQQVAGLFQFMRVRRTLTGVTPVGTPTVKIGAEVGAGAIFAAMNVPPDASSSGTPVDLSTGGSLNTFTVVGAFSGRIIIEVSTDAGVTWSPALVFDSGGRVSQNFVGVISRARVQRRTTPGPTPNVAVASGELDPGGAGGGFGPPGNFSNTILTRAITLTGITQPIYWDDPFLQMPGRPGSLWQDNHAVDMKPEKAYPGGVMRLFPNVDFGTALIDPSGAYPFIVAFQPSWFGQVNTVPPLYMFFRFMLVDDGFGWDPTHDSLILGFVDGENVKCAGVGIALGQNRFGAVGGDLTTVITTVGIDSTVPIDFGVWHTGELYTRAGLWWCKIDAGAPFDVSALFAAPANYSQPIIQIMTDAARVPTVLVDHAAYVMPGNGPTLSAVPT